MFEAIHQLNLAFKKLGLAPPRAIVLQSRADWMDLLHWVNRQPVSHVTNYDKFKLEIYGITFQGPNDAS